MDIFFFNTNYLSPRNINEPITSKLYRHCRLIQMWRYKSTDIICQFSKKIWNRLFKNDICTTCLLQFITQFREAESWNQCMYRWSMNKERAVCKHRGILFSLHNKEILLFAAVMELENIVLKWSKPGIERRTHILMNVQNLKQLKWKKPTVQEPSQKLGCGATTSWWP